MTDPQQFGNKPDDSASQSQPGQYQPPTGGYESQSGGYDAQSGGYEAPSTGYEGQYGQYGTPPGGQYPPPPGQYPPPPPGQYPPPGQFPPPASAGYFDASAPYGRHPMTGEPYSDKSRTVAGLLQLIGIVGFVGIGRIYIGQVGLGVAQLLIGLLGGAIIGILTCGVGLLIPVIWGIVDCFVLINGDGRDQFGRPLRNGT